MADNSDRLETVCDGINVTIRKKAVHQWRTDLWLDVNGRSYLLGRLEGGMTRREVKEVARRWLANHPEHSTK